MAALEEKEEEAGRSRDHMTKKKGHTYHPFVISCPWPFGGVVHNPPRVAHIFGKISCILLQGHELVRLSARYRLGVPTVETLRTAHKFSTVVLEIPYTRFLSGPLDDFASINKSESKFGWVKGLPPYLSYNRLLYVSLK